MATEFKEVKGGHLTGAKWDTGLGTLPEGNLAGVSAASADKIVAWNEHGSLFFWTNGKWEKDTGAAGCVSVSILPDGEVWVVNKKGDVYRKIKGNWTKAPGDNITQISAASDKYVVATNAQGQLFIFNEGKFEQDHGAAGCQSIAIGVDGDLWVVNKKDEIYRKVNGHLKGSWTKVNGKGKKIAVHDANNVFLLDEHGVPHQHSGGQWIAGPGKELVHISAGNGVLLCQNNNHHAWLAKGKAHGGGGGAAPAPKVPDFPLRDANEGDGKVRITVNGAKALRIHNDVKVDNQGGEGELTFLEMHKFGADKYQLRRGDRFLRIKADNSVDGGGAKDGPYTFFKVVANGDGVSLHYTQSNQYLGFNGEAAVGVAELGKAAVFHITARA